MKPVEMHSIPHASHRFETVGDYYDGENGTHIMVSDMNNEDYEVLVCLHEFIEQYLCKKRGIAEPDIVAFDVQFEKEREEGLHEDWEESGMSKEAPYVQEHTFATAIEMLMAEQLKINWDEYNNFVMSL